MAKKSDQQAGERAAAMASGGLPRRTFLKVAGLSLAACSMGEALSGCNNKQGQPARVIKARVRRPDDLLVVDFEFINFSRSNSVLKRHDDDEDAFVIVHFPRQHVLEEVVDGAAMDSPPAPPLRSLLSGPSRVAFKLPVGVNELTYTLDGLLSAVRDYELAVHENASPRAGVPLPPEKANPMEPDDKAPPVGQNLSAGQLIIGAESATNQRITAESAPGLAPKLDLDVTAPPPRKPAKPGAHHTAIELPTRLLISPNRFARFRHASAPVTSASGRVELWHTRLAALTAKGKVDEQAAALRTIRALWVRGQEIDPNDPSFDPSEADPSWDAPLNSLQRNQIVHQTSNWTQVGSESGKAEAAQPVDVERLILSALGGYLDARGEWSQKSKNALTGWSHRATLGRDHYVETTEEGFLFPFGNRAARVTISERKIARSPRTAYLFKRTFLVVREPIKHYGSGNANAEVARMRRQLPFASIELRQLITPNLDLPEDNQPFVPTVSGKTYRFPVRFVDVSGQLISAEVPMVWLPAQRVASWSDAERASAQQLLDQPDGGAPRSRVPFAGQRISLAPREGSKGTTDNTSYETRSLKFRSGNLSGSQMAAAKLDVPFLPMVEVAELAVEAARAFAGAEQEVAFKYAQRYIEHGFDAAQNAGELLFELAQEAGLDVNFNSQSDKSGGFLAPSMKINGLSRLQGAVAGALDKVADGQFDAESFFAGALPKLFGVFSLTEILSAAGLEAAPKFITDVVDEVQAFIADLSRLEAQLKDLQSKVQALASDAQEIVDQITQVLTALTDGSIAEADFQPGGLLDGLIAALKKLDADVAALPAVPPAARRFVREAIARVLEALGVADKLLEAIQRFKEAQELIKNRVVRLEFRPPIKADKLNIFQPARTDGLVLAAEIRAKAVGNKPAGADLICSLEDFKIQIPNAKKETVFGVDFERVQFIARAGKKPDVDVVLNGLTFGGPLAFIERIKEIIPLDGFSDPPALEVGLDGIKATFSLPLPNVAVGIFALENISISAGFRIPFLGDAISLNFGFCSRENPFSLTVAMLGGGGFVGLELTPSGVRLLEISLEFGASLAMDFAVASGGVEIKAGIYFALEGKDVTLMGYLRIRGHVQVLGIIGASIELAMELTYQSATGKVIGRARLKIEVTILCFSIGVTLEVERKFAGSNGDPTFAEVFQPLEAPALPTEGIDAAGTPWAQYVNAFAF